MPGSLSIALTASPLMPTAALLPGKRVALCAPAIPVVAQVAERLGAPLLGVYGGRNASDTDMLLDAGELPPAQPTVLDVTRRPARILQAGAPERAILERIVLLEE
jgi:tRNA A37 threonylcarbamoyladenosine synthetase subunit TsaC/SUA5/YrdC